MQPADGAPQPALPELRQDLKIERGADGPGGVPAWLIVDAAQHRYVQIDVTAYQLLSRWQTGASYADFAIRVSAEFGTQVQDHDVAEFVRFLAGNALTVEPLNGGWRHFATLADSARHGWFMWLVHNYLFIKIPLIRPEPLLARLAPWTEIFYSRTCALVIASAGVTGLYLISRHWSEFWGTFQHFYSWQGALTYGLALFIVKSAHEMGHALTARRFGCRVPSMGVCFLVMFPVLYTDVTDAWRLQSRRHRLMIGAAGIAVELALACLATFLWVFLPEGILKSVSFSIATVGWVLSLAVNLNPLMRFDGYYLFSDWLGVDNLQQRAFAFGVWRMRKVLFGLSDAAPERLPARTVTGLVVYAWIVWVYRFTLFTGIALLVYHMAFKVLGIVLFLVEIIYFVAGPIAAELKAWWKDREKILKARRVFATGTIAGVLLVLACWPWSTRILIPAVLEASELARIYPPSAGTIAALNVKPGDKVKAGDVIAVLDAQEIHHQIAVTEKRIKLVRMRLARRSSDEEDLSKSLVLEQELQSLVSAQAGNMSELEKLSVLAPFPGTIAEVNPDLHAGRAVARSEPLALIRGDGPLAVRGYVAGDNVQRLQEHASGHFTPEQPEVGRIAVTLGEVAQSGASDIEIPELASVHGGPIAVRAYNADGRHRRLVPISAMYLSTLSVADDEPALTYSLRGVVELDGEARSLMSRFWQQVAAVLVRESGF